MKDYLRDYATAAFRFYAKNNMSAEEYRRKIYDGTLANITRREGSSGISKPTEAAIIAAENAVNEKIAEIKDMEAVEKVIAELKANYRYDMLKAIEFVYFKDAETDLQLGDIQSRVHEAVIEIPASERVVYYWLRQARNLFSMERGLRLKEYVK